MFCNFKKILKRRKLKAGTANLICVEHNVLGEVAEVIRTGQGKLLHFGVSNEMAWEVGLACGGEVDIYLEKLT